MLLVCLCWKVSTGQNCEPCAWSADEASAHNARCARCYWCPCTWCGCWASRKTSLIWKRFQLARTAALLLGSWERVRLHNQRSSIVCVWISWQYWKVRGPVCLMTTIFYLIPLVMFWTYCWATCQSECFVVSILRNLFEFRLTEFHLKFIQWAANEYFSTWYANLPNVLS